MNTLSRRRPFLPRSWTLITASVLAVASAGALLLFASTAVIPSVIRNPLFDFVQPGVTVWWLVLGGPFRSTPSSPAGLAFAAAANAAFWLLALWLVVVAVRLVRR